MVAPRGFYDAFIRYGASSTYLRSGECGKASTEQELTDFFA